jgi:membrane protein DedA with SNARE-associated domain
MPRGESALQQWIVTMVERFGYVGVLLLIAAENIFPPIPSEVILTFAGFLTTCTAMRVPGVVLFSTLGSVVGALVLYGVGRLLSVSRLAVLLDGTVGRVLHVEKADVEKAACRFSARGWSSVLYCRCVPIVRSLISIPAGMAKMRLLPFVLLTALGSTVWNMVLVSAGALAGQSWPAVCSMLERISGKMKLVLLGAALLVAVFVLLKKHRKAGGACS